MRSWIGLAHGAIVSFGEDDAAPIPPDRAARAGLDYLALGDWHRRIEVDVRTFYSGTPEPDAFKRSGDDDSRCNGGEALLVELRAPGSPPEVTPLPTASYIWHQIKTRLNEQADVDALADRLERLGRPDRLLVDLSLEGVISLAARNLLEDRIVEHFGAALRWLRLHDQRLVLELDDADLATMGEGGLIRAAGERLQRMAHDAEPEQARIAQLALKTLYLEHLRAGA